MKQFAKLTMAVCASALAVLNVCAQSTNPPVLGDIPDQTIVELTRLTVTNSAVGATNHLNYSLLGAPSGAVIDTNGIITWFPSEAQGPSTNVITTVVADDSFPPLTAFNRFTVIVTETNSPPRLQQPPDQTVVAGTTMHVNNDAFDSDLPANTVSYALIAPPGAAIDQDLGIISWTPDASLIGTTNTITTIATDDGVPPLSATNSFQVVVISPDAIYWHTNALIPVNFNLSGYVQTYIPTPSTNLVAEVQTLRLSGSDLIATIGRNRGLGTNIFPKDAKLYLKLPDMQANGAVFVVRSGSLESNILNSLQLSAPSDANQYGGVTGVLHQSGDGTTNQVDYVVLKFDMGGSRASFSVRGLALLRSSSVKGRGGLISSEPVLNSFTAAVAGSGQVFLNQPGIGSTPAFFRGTVTGGSRKIEVVQTSEP